MDVTPFTALLEGWDPAVTVTLDVTGNDRSGWGEVALRWREVHAGLERDGADPADIAALEEIAAQPHGRGGCRTRLMASRGGRVVLHEVVSGGMPDGIGSGHVGPVVDVVPLLRERARQAPVVVVRADGQGTDIELVTAAAEPPAAAGTVGRTMLHLHKVPVGGWRQNHLQNRCENVWRGNAERAADEVNRLIRDHRPVAVLLSGETRALCRLEPALDEPVPVVEVRGDTGADGASVDGVDPALVRLLDEHAARAEDEAVHRWRTAHDDEDKPGSSAGDLAGTVAAMLRGQVEELLVVPAALRSRPLLVGPGGADLGPIGGAARWSGGIREEASDLALIRAAAHTGARVQLVDVESAALPDGVAARIRRPAAVA